MPSFVLSQSHTAPGPHVPMGADNGAYTILTQFTTIVSTAGTDYAISGSGTGQSVTIAGQLFETEIGAPIHLTGDRAVIEVLSTGVVSASGWTYYRPAIVLGWLSSGHVVTNHGTISGSSGVWIGNGVIGWESVGALPSSVLNHGTISGRGMGNEEFFDAGIIAGGNVRIVNTGTVSGAHQTGIDELFSELHGLPLAILGRTSSEGTGWQLTVENSGLLQGWVVGYQDLIEVLNTGLIEGQVLTGSELCAEVGDA